MLFAILYVSDTQTVLENERGAPGNSPWEPKTAKFWVGPAKKSGKKNKNGRFWALRAAFEPIYNASGVKNHARSHFSGPRDSKPS